MCAIVDRLSEEGVSVSQTATFELVKKFKNTKGVCNLCRAPQPQKLEEIHYRFIDNEMSNNNDLTSYQLLALFKEKYPNANISLSTIKRSRLKLGWVSKQVMYGEKVTVVSGESRQWRLRYG